MKLLFNMDNPVVLFLCRIFDIAYVNVLCLICCIPVITIGPSVTALYYCMLKISRDNDFSITEMFFHSFKKNLKQGILMTILFAGIVIFLILDIRICCVIDFRYKDYIRGILYVGVIGAGAVISYAFPLLAQFENTVMESIKNALILAFCNLRYTVGIVTLNAVPVVLFLIFSELFMLTVPIWIFGGFSAIAWINSKMFVKIFDKLINVHCN